MYGAADTCGGLTELVYRSSSVDLVEPVPILVANQQELVTSGCVHYPRVYLHRLAQIDVVKPGEFPGRNSGNSGNSGNDWR